MRKYEMALLLGQKYGFTSYLEICTPTTGGTYARVDKKQFTRRVRLMYRCASGFNDGEAVDFSTGAESGEELFHGLMKGGERFDIVFIDPFHTYTASLRDIVYGMQLVKPGGLVLIHDCLPTNAQVAAPEFVRGEWCGVTYAAFLDVVLFGKELSYCTVDSDYGCGIISRDNRLAAFADCRPADELISQWRGLGLSEKYPFFERHRAELLRLISPDEFRQRLLAGSFHGGV